MSPCDKLVIQYQITGNARYFTKCVYIVYVVKYIIFREPLTDVTSLNNMAAVIAVKAAKIYFLIPIPVQMS